MERYDCPYLGHSVEFTDERAAHVAERHPELLPRYEQEIGQTLADPDAVRVSRRMPSARLFSRWFESVMRGKYVVVVVVSDRASHRYWVVTAYVSQREAEGEIEWERT